MALDFFIGDPSETMPPAWSLPEQMHAQLFHRTDELRRLPQLGGGGPFYSDTSFEGADLAALLQELQQVLPAFTGRPQMHATLQQLCEICQTAINQGKGLYGFCD